MPPRAQAKAQGKAKAAAAKRPSAAKTRRNAQVATSNARRDGRRAALRALNGLAREVGIRQLPHPTWFDPRVGPGIQTHQCSSSEKKMKRRHVEPLHSQRIGQSAWIFKLFVFLPFFLSRTEGSSTRRNVRDRAACTCSCRSVQRTTSPTAASNDLIQALPCSISSALSLRSLRSLCFWCCSLASLLPRHPPALA